MIYVVTTRREEHAFMPQARFAHLEKAFGPERIQRIFADDVPDFGFIAQKDTVLVQTRDRRITDALIATGAKTTAESEETVHLTYDKEASKAILAKYGIPTPKTIVEPDDGGLYFVKPLHGEDSNCIDEHSICRTKEDVRKKVIEIETFLGDSAIIEEFVPGQDCTVGVMMDLETGVPFCWPVILDYESEAGILTHELKFKEVDVSRELPDEKLMQYARDAFMAVGAKRYMRIDFRRRKPDCEYVLIDLNLYPCLGATDHLAGCAHECAKWPYELFIEKVIATATR